MVKIGPLGPKANTLDVDEEYTYADTLTETWQVIKFFLEDIEPIDVEDWKREEDLKPEDHRCDICTEDFTIDDHRSVRLPCNHMFGEPCMKTWLRPYAKWVTPYTTLEPINPLGANTCPKCRREFFSEQTTYDLLPVIKMRIMIWDQVYAYVGIALSERELQAREDLLQYLNSHPTGESDEYYPYNFLAGSLNRNWNTGAHFRLLMFSRRLRGQNLTPVQEHLRQILENFVRYELVQKSKWVLNEQGELSFKIEEDLQAVTDSESGKQDEEVEVEEESEELAEGDTEEMRFFRALFR